MQIEETSTQIEQKAKEAAMSKDQGFEFTVINLADPKAFPNFKSKDTQEKFFKWGITDAN